MSAEEYSQRQQKEEKEKGVSILKNRRSYFIKSGSDECRYRWAHPRKGGLKKRSLPVLDKKNDYYDDNNKRQYASQDSSYYSESRRGNNPVMAKLTATGPGSLRYERFSKNVSSSIQHFYQ